MARGHEDFHRKMDLYIVGPSIDLASLAASLNLTLSDLAVRLDVEPAELAAKLGLTVDELNIVPSWGIDELAARLWSPTTLDRRGRVLWMDDFEDGLPQWEVHDSPADTTITLDTTRALRGAQSARLAIAVTTLQIVDMRRFEAFMSAENMGIEAAMTCHPGAAEIQLGVEVFDGADVIRFYIRYVPSEEKFQYYTTEGAWEDLTPSMSLVEVEQCFHRWKLVYDVATQSYIRFRCNNQEWDMIGLPAAVLPWPSPAYSVVDIILENVVGETTGINVDSVIMTRQEPA